MTITVREARAQDVDFLVDMNRIVHELHLTAAPAYFRQHDPAAVAEWFCTRLQRRPDVRVWIAEVDGVPAGHAVSAVRERPQNAVSVAQRYLELEEIGVVPARRQQGVARALVERVLAEAREQQLSEVQLSSWAFNVAAHQAFEALGFRPLTVRFCRDSG